MFSASPSLDAAAFLELALSVTVTNHESKSSKLKVTEAFYLIRLAHGLALSVIQYHSDVVMEKYNIVME